MQVLSVGETVEMCTTLKFLTDQKTVAVAELGADMIVSVHMSHTRTHTHARARTRTPTRIHTHTYTHTHSHTHTYTPIRVAHTNEARPECK